VAHRDVLHVEVRDESGGTWRLASQDADWAPTEPATLVGQRVQRATLDPGRGELRLDLSGSEAVRIAESRDQSGELPTWELISPGGLALEFGPGLRWTVSQAQAPMVTAQRECNGEAGRSLARKQRYATEPGSLCRVVDDERFERLEAVLLKAAVDEVGAARALGWLVGNTNLAVDALAVDHSLA
jgi:hypothetical protein